MDHKLQLNNISYLCNITTALSGLQASNMLKSYYLIKSHTLEMRAKASLPTKFNKSSFRCQRCRLLHSDSGATYEVKPKRKESSFVRKLLRKCNKNKELTNYQIKHFKKLKQLNGNELVVTCNLCKTQSKHILSKPEKVKNSAEKITSTQKSKKKKKKDKFSGLDKNIVMSVACNKNKTLNKQESKLKNSDANEVVRNKKLNNKNVNNTQGKQKNKKKQNNLLQTCNKVVKKKDKKGANLNSLAKVFNEFKQNQSKPKNTNLKQFLASL